MRPPPLHVVRESEACAPDGDAGAGGNASGGDLVLVASVLALCLVPLVGLLAGGHWGQGTAGIAAAGALLSGRELARGLRERTRR
ncbi:MAG TPA: hypothetical protein VF912_14655 [Anaeromyxobacter sp.]